MGTQNGAAPNKQMLEMAELGRARDAYETWRLDPTPEQRGVKARDAFSRLESVTGCAKTASLKIRNENFRGAVGDLKMMREQIDKAIADLGGDKPAAKPAAKPTGKK